LSSRSTTPYYDLTVDAIKQNIFKDNFNESIQYLKDYINYDNLDEDQQEKWDQEILWLEGATLRADSLFKKSSVHLAKEILMKYIDEKFVETEWYKNNHYKKLERGEVTRYVYTPTPLWTNSIPTNEDYLTLEPNNAYKTRSVNEFLLDENGIPTNIRLKRGDTTIDAKQGDTLETISQYYNIDFNELKKMNPTITGILEEGDKVVIKKFGDRSFGNKEPKEYLEDGTLSKYVDLEYRKLESQNPALVKVIDDINDIFYEHQNKSGVRGLAIGQAFPRVATSGWETILDESGPTVKKIIKKGKEIITVTPYDADNGYSNSDFADVELQTIPLKFLSDIPYELRSRDAFGLLMAFIVHANEISQLNALFPVTKELYNIVNANSPAVTREKKILSKLLPGGKLVPIRQKSGNNRGLHLGHMLNSKFFNIKKQQVNIGSFALTKMYDFTASMTSRATLGGVITPSIVMNYVVGKAQIWIEVWSGGIISRSDYEKGLKRIYRYFSSDFNNDFYKLGEKSVNGQLMLRYNPTIKTSLELFGQELKRTPVKDYLSMDVLFKTRRLAEMELAGGVTFGLLESYYVMDQDRQIPLVEAYELDKDGNLTLKSGLKKMNGKDFTQDDEDRIIIKSIQTNMIIQGNYSSHHKPEFDTTFVGNMISFMRKHLGSYVEKAWSPRHYNYALDMFIGGYQRELWGTAIQMAKAIKDGNAEDLNEEIKIAKEKWKKDPTLKKAVVHNSILILISILLAIVDSEDDDDNKKTHSYDSFFAKAMIYQLMRLKSDLELASAIPFVAGLNESLNIIKSPSIVIDKTMVNVVKIASHIWTYGKYKLGMADEKDVVLSRDYYMYKKGDLKILKDFGQLTGITGATYYPDEMVDKLKNINSALFR
jgi:LysM repeat protein